MRFTTDREVSSLMREEIRRQLRRLRRTRPSYFGLPTGFTFIHREITVTVLPPKSKERAVSAKKNRPRGYDGKFQFTDRAGAVTEVTDVCDAVDYLSCEGDGVEAVVVRCCYFNPRGTPVFQYAVSPDGSELAAYADHPKWNVHDFLAGQVGRRYVETWSDGRESSVRRLA